MEKEQETTQVNSSRRILLRVAYDGTNYHGWQYQEGLPTIQGEVERALSELLKEEVHVVGGSRTDAGVHALSNVCVFDTSSRIPGEKFPYALHPLLPSEIRIVEGREVDAAFHPRHCDTKKTYEYRISLGEFENPLNRLYTHHTNYALDITLMQAAAKAMEGEHDFTSFCTVGAQVSDFVRCVYSVDVTMEEKDTILITVTGNGFLYNMVRIMAGTLIEAGKGRYQPEDIREMIAARDRAKAGPTAPAKGLRLAKYEFL
ncbi:MAG: tRNA pseudouridine(38-40) synthase TruA [Lachnospiraceae bacterium]|nr:tRNA pseudouridine(38-40) synthase TruA [Lachnospiraceae bacterium]